MSDYYLGLMSGTSMDGIDAALVDFSGQQPKLVASHATEWPPELKARLHAAAAGAALTADALALLHAQTGEQFAKAALECCNKAPHATVSGIGSHGQTLAHNPSQTRGYSLQIGNAALITERTGITTVADFRSRDIAAGGQGAPLVPAFHAAALSAQGQTRVVLNIGGIANITVLAADPKIPPTGFDTGPGNCLMDAWTRQHFAQAYDREGQIAASGQLDETLLKALLADPYFTLSAPKSTGTDYFSPDWLARKITGTSVTTADIQTTLMALTAHSIADAIDQQAPDATQVLACGGGVHNKTLMRYLAERLSCPLTSTETEGIAPDWMEAMAFAWLARETLGGRPGNISSVTGALGPRILGAIYPA